MVGCENVIGILALFYALKKSITSKILRLALRLALSLVPIPFQNVILSSKHKNEQSLRGRVDIRLKWVSIYIRLYLFLCSKQNNGVGMLAVRKWDAGIRSFVRSHYITQKVETQDRLFNPPIVVLIRSFNTEKSRLAIGFKPLLSLIFRVLLRKAPTHVLPSPI